MNILCWLAAGVLIKRFCSEKVVGALIGVGALKGMNTVLTCQVAFNQITVFYITLKETEICNM